MATAKGNGKPVSFDDLANDFGGKEVVDDVAGWVKAKVGLIVHGKLKGHKYDAGKENYFFFVELMRPCLIQTGKDDKDEPMFEELPIGSIVGMTERYKLKPLREYVDSEGEFLLMFTEKIKVGKGRTLWKQKLKIKGKRNPDYKPSRIEAELETDAEPF